MPTKTRTEKRKTLQIAGVPESDIERFRGVKEYLNGLSYWCIFKILLDHWEKDCGGDNA